jgi:ABC-2 type transport system ATP-binding protein
VIDEQVRIERRNGHRFVTDLVEGFPGEINGVSIAKPSLEDVFIRRTGHRFWNERDENIHHTDAAPPRKSTKGLK